MQRRRERRTLLLAILASLLLHFAVGISIASFGGKLQPPVPEEDKPAELTLVDLAPTPPQAMVTQAPFIETDQKRESKEQPKEKTFESNANSVAASEAPASGEMPVPSQQGKDRPNLDLETREHSLAMQGAQPQPTPPPTPPPPKATATPVPTPTPQPTVTPNEELLAMFRATPPPATSRAPEEAEASATPELNTPPPTPRPTPPQAPSSAYRREQTQTRVHGNISNHGISSVNAVGTPLGRYQKILGDAVGSRWYALVDRNRDRVNIGTVHVEFVVDRAGHITKVRILENSSDESFSNLCLQSVQDAKVPPIPDDLAATLPTDGLPADMTFTIYPR